MMQVVLSLYNSLDEFKGTEILFLQLKKIKNIGQNGNSYE